MVVKRNDQHASVKRMKDAGCGVKTLASRNVRYSRFGQLTVLFQWSKMGAAVMHIQDKAEIWFELKRVKRETGRRGG